MIATRKSSGLSELSKLAAGWHLPSEWRSAGDVHCDIYLAFAGVPSLRAVGFLVTAKDRIDELVAFCPLDDRVDAATLSGLRRELTRQLRIATRVAADPDGARQAVDLIWLGWVGAEDRPAPQWIYGLNCIPLTRSQPWDGRFVRPRPFCPRLFQAMAEQPKAIAWLRSNPGEGAPGIRGSRPRP